MFLIVNKAEAAEAAIKPEFFMTLTDFRDEASRQVYKFTIPGYQIVMIRQNGYIGPLQIVCTISSRGNRAPPSHAIKSPFIGNSSTPRSS
jgi:hypothetical protein